MKKNTIFLKIIFALLCLPMGAQAMPWYQEAYAMMPSMPVYLPTFSDFGSACRDKISSAFAHPATGWIFLAATAAAGIYAYHKQQKRTNSLRMELDSAKNLNKKYEAHLKTLQGGYETDLETYKLVIQEKDALLKSAKLLHNNTEQQDDAYKKLMADAKIILENKTGNSPRETGLRIN
jgi:hypothetical protein